MSKAKYRSFNIEYICPPIPIRTSDWSWCHEDYDGPEDHRIGTCATEADCREAIDNYYAEIMPEFGDNVHIVSANQTGMVYEIEGDQIVVQTPRGLISATIEDLDIVAS